MAPRPKVSEDGLVWWDGKTLQSIRVWIHILISYLIGDLAGFATSVVKFFRRFSITILLKCWECDVFAKGKRSWYLDWPLGMFSMGKKLPVKQFQSPKQILLANVAGPGKDIPRYCLFIPVMSMWLREWSSCCYYYHYYDHYSEIIVGKNRNKLMWLCVCVCVV